MALPIAPQTPAMINRINKPVSVMFIPAFAASPAPF
jgi:hypothetical protein